MNISAVSGVSNGMPLGKSQAVDAQTKSLQNQIMNVQKQLQKLAENTEMSATEKIQKRQELNQQITDLNNQLREHQIEVRKEQQEAKKESSKQEMPSKKNEIAYSQEDVVSQTSIKTIISADNNINLARVSKKVATKMDGKVGVYEIEIKLDGDRGRVIDHKVEELSEIRRKAKKATISQMGSLSRANKDMKKAQKKMRRRFKKMKIPLKKRKRKRQKM